MSKAFVKLVRDRIGENATGRVTFGPVHPRLKRRLLHYKLREEAIEFADMPSIEELADVLQAAQDVARVEGWDWLDVIRAKEEKRRSRGGFVDGVAMFVGVKDDDEG